MPEITTRSGVRVTGVEVDFYLPLRNRLQAAQEVVGQLMEGELTGEVTRSARRALLVTCSLLLILICSKPAPRVLTDRWGCQPRTT